MSVTRKPADEKRAPQEPLPNDPAFHRYLRKGGSAASAGPESKAVSFTLTVPSPMCLQIDQLREELLPLKKSRHQWVLEACMEKIKRDQKAEAE
jgi:hypothetical protein